MFTSSKGLSAVNAIMAREGKFEWDQLKDTAPSMEIKVAYANSNTGTTYGYCDVRAHLLSAETIEAFAKFIQLAEKDFANIVLADPQKEPESLQAWPTDTRRAETNDGLKKGIGNL